MVFSGRQRAAKKRKTEKSRKGRDWIVKKKEQRRNRGIPNVPRDSRYTGRKRKAKF